MKWRSTVVGVALALGAILVLRVMLNEGLKSALVLPFGALAGIAVIEVVWWSYGRRPTPPPASWRATRDRYLVVVVGFILIAGVLPALAFFRAASRIETAIYVRHAQRGLLEGLWSRNGRIRSEWDDVMTRAARLGTDLDIYGDRLFGMVVRKDRGAWAPPLTPATPIVGSTANASSPLTQVFERIRLLYNDTAIDTQALVHPTMGDDSVRWRVLGTREELLVSGDEAPLLSSDVASGWPPPSPTWWVALVVGALSLLVVVGWLVRLLAARVFLLNFDEPVDPIETSWDAHDVRQSTLILGPPFAGKSALLRRPGHPMIDLRRVALPATGVPDLSQTVGDKRLVAIDHLDYRADDADTNGRKLALLQHLLDQNRTLIVASSIDPLEFTFPNTHGNDQDWARWVGLVSTFTTIYVRGGGDPREYLEGLVDERRKRTDPGAAPAFAKLARECFATAYLQAVGLAIGRELDMSTLTESQIVAEVADRAAAHYYAIWATCNREERLALYDLAQDGFINAQNPGIRTLLRRGLVLRTPALRLVNESFRRFVLKVGAAEGIGSWDEANVPNRWNAVKWPVFAAAGFGALLLFMAHREVFDTGVLFVGALGTGVAGVFKLLDFMKVTKPAT
jgi:hypothetical protein